MKDLVTALTATTLAALLIAACGVGASDDLFTPSGGGGASSGGGTMTTGSVASSTNGSSSSGATTGSSSSASGSSGGGGTSGSTTSSSSSTSTSTSSSTSGAPVTVACNGMPCSAGEICCFNTEGPGDHCAQPGQCDPGWVVITCNGPEDCPGGACCATVDFNMQVPYLGIACQPSCSPDQLVMCSEAQPDVCPAGTMCRQSMVLGAGYRYCGN